MGQEQIGHGSQDRFSGFFRRRAVVFAFVDMTLEPQNTGSGQESNKNYASRVAWCMDGRSRWGRNREICLALPSSPRLPHKRPWPRWLEDVQLRRLILRRRLPLTLLCLHV